MMISSLNQGKQKDSIDLSNGWQYRSRKIDVGDLAVRATAGISAAK